MVLDRRPDGGAARSHVFVASPPLWKPPLAPDAAPSMKLLQKHPFGRASPGAAQEAAQEALPNRASECKRRDNLLYFFLYQHSRKIFGFRCQIRYLGVSYNEVPFDRIKVCMVDGISPVVLTPGKV